MFQKFLVVMFCLMSTMLVAQVQSPSKIILKNKDVITGKIIELKPGEFIKIEITGNNIITIPYAEVDQLIFDSSQYSPPVESARKSSVPHDSKSLKKFYFQINSELVLGLGVGKVYGLPKDFPTVVNDDVFSGFYTSFGVGYNKQLFAGLGFGFYGNKNDPNYSIPYVLDLRYVILKDKRFSPMIAGTVGAIYHEGSLGSFTFSDAVGLNVAPNDKLNLNILFTHTYLRFIPGLSLRNDEVESLYSNLYFNYLGIRLGAAFRF